MGGESFRPRDPEEEKVTPRIPPTPEQIEAVVESHKRAQEMTLRHYELEKQGRQELADIFTDKKIDYLWTYYLSIWDPFPELQKKEVVASLDIAKQQTEAVKAQEDIKPKEQMTPIKEKKEKLNGITESSELQKEVIKKGILANLVYSEFTVVPETGKHKVTGVTLDPLGFPSLDKIFGADSPDFNSDEKYLNAYVRENYNKTNIDRNIHITDDVAEIMRIAGFYKQETKSNIANISDAYRPSLNDVPNPLYSELPNFKDLLLANGIEALKKKKIVENGKTLKDVEEKYDIIDYFPNDGDIKDIKAKEEALRKKPHSKGDLIEHANLSSFGAVCVVDKDTKEKTIAIRGTRLSSWKDIKADINLLLQKVPEEQVLDMITFVNRNVKSGEQVDLAAHSLGGAMGQVLTAMYTKRGFDPKHREQGTLIKKAFVYNSPGAKGLSVNIDRDSLPPEIIAKFDDFVYNDTNNVVGELITSIRGMKGPSLIAGLNKQMGNNEIQLKELMSHSIVKLVEYVRDLKDLKELDSVKIREMANPEHNIVVYPN